MKFAPLSIAPLLIALALLSGCTTFYRTESGIKMDDQKAINSQQKVIISEDSLPGREYREIEPVTAEVRKLTYLHRDPTREQVDAVLAKKAKKLGANAVINVKYEEGVGMMTWGYIRAEGMAVKLTD